MATFHCFNNLFRVPNTRFIHGIVPLPNDACIVRVCLLAFGVCKANDVIRIISQQFI
jgi:hypothetical protein